MSSKGIWNDASILVVDDLEQNLTLLKAILRREGYTNIRTANDGDTALAMVRERVPDLILLDLNMPRMRGDEVMRHLQEMVPAGNYLPVVILTADTNPDSRRELLGLGAVDFIAKPFDLSEVSLRVRNLLHTRSLHVRLERQVPQSGG